METDSPYLAPVPHRGKRNESSYLDLVVGKLVIFTIKILQKLIELQVKMLIKFSESNFTQSHKNRKDRNEYHYGLFFKNFLLLRKNLFLL